MKKEFRRCLSFMLALILVAGIIPAGSISFAAVGDAEVYNLVAVGGTPHKTFLEYDSNRPNWKFFDMCDDLWSIFRTGTTPSYATDVDADGSQAKRVQGAVLYATKDTRLRFIVGDYGKVIVKDGWFALKLKAPEASGVYSMNIALPDDGIYGAQSVSVWLAPYEAGQDDGAYYMTDANRIINAQKFNTKGGTVTVEGINVSDVDEFVAVFRLNGRGQTTNWELHLKNISFVQTETIPGKTYLGDLEKVAGAPEGYQAVVIPEFETYGLQTVEISKSYSGRKDAFSVYVAEYRGGSASDYMTEENLVGEEITYVDGKATIAEAFTVQNNVPHILIIGDSAKEIELKKVRDVPYLFDFTKPYKASDRRTWIDQYTTLNPITNQNWTFLDYSDDFAAIRGVSEYSALDIRTNVFVSYGLKLANSYDNDAKYMRSKAWTALHLVATEPGIYDLSFGVNTSQTYGARKAKVYFAPYEEGRNDGEYYMTTANLKASNTNLTNVKIENVVADGTTEFVVVIDVSNTSYNDYMIEKIALTKVGELETEYTYAVTGAEMKVPTPVNAGVYEVVLNAKSGNSLSGVRAYIAPEGTANIVSDENMAVSSASGESFAGEKVFATKKDVKNLDLYIDGASGVESVTLKKILGTRLLLDISPEVLVVESVGEIIATAAGKRLLSWGVEFATSDATIATVDRAGAIETKLSGEVTFSAIAGGLLGEQYSDEITTKVLGYEEATLPEKIVGKISDAELVTGETAVMSYICYSTIGLEYVDSPDTDEDDVTVYYDSADPIIASVDKNGIVTAKASGSTVIRVYAKCRDLLMKSEVPVVVSDNSGLSGVTVSGPSEVEQNFEIKLRASATNESGHRALAEEVIFDYANEAAREILDVSANGVVRGIAPGTAGVVATFISTTGEEMQSGQYEITVTPPHPVDKVVDFRLGKLAAGATTATFEKHGYEVNEELTDPFLIADSYATKPDNFRWLGEGLFCNTKKNVQNYGNVKDADVSFNVKIDHSGWYLPRFAGARYYNSTTRADIYINREYIGCYDFYSPIVFKDGYPKKLNPIYLEAGVSLLTFRTVEVNPERNDQMYLQALELEYIDEAPELLSVILETERTTLAVGETERIDTFATLEGGLTYEFGFRHGYAGSEAYPENTPSDDAYTEYSSSDESVAKVENGKLIAVAPGTCWITATAHLLGSEMESESIMVTVTNETLGRLEVLPETVNLIRSKSQTLDIKAFLTDGSQIDPKDMTVTCVSNQTAVAVIDPNPFRVYGAGVGTATVTVGVTFNGKTISKTIPVTVINEGFASIEATAFSQVLRPGSAGYNIKVRCLDVAGKEMDKTGAIITYQSSDEKVVKVSSGGYMTPVGVGTAEILVSVELGGIVREKTMTISVRNGKTEKTYYTDEKVANARANAELYSWAKSSVASTVEMAEKYVNFVDHLYEMMPSEGIPRASAIGHVYDRDNAYTCRYCGIDLQAANIGTHAWKIDALNAPWKIKCPKCSRSFPTNDFGSFYELGKNEKGEFNLQYALNRHREKFLTQIEENYGAEYVTMPAPTEEYTEDWYKYYGYGIKGGYLTNNLYPEVADKDPWTGAKTEGNGRWWGVDNGWGWRSGRTVDEGKPEIAAYIALYLHDGLWNSTVSASNVRPAIYHGMHDSALAYVYTGDKRYARTAAILLDRIADFYPDYDLNEYYKIYRNSNEHGKQGGGKILGNIHEPAMLAKHYGPIYDAVFDIYEDPEVLDFLTEKAIKYNLADKLVDGRVTPETLRTNVERNILMELLPAVKVGDITGNFGFFQDVLVKTAIVLDDPVLTPELLQFTMQAGVESGGYGHKNTKTWTACTGGNVLAQIVNTVDRDGYGDESSIGYNVIWASRLLSIAEDLVDYAKIRPEYVEPSYNLLQNPKYIKMLKMYYPTAVSGAVYANIGDSSDVGRRAPSYTAGGNASLEMAGFEATRLPIFAQLLYRSNGGTVDGLHSGIFTADPEAIKDEISEVIAEYGELDYSKAQLLSGYGYSSLISGNGTKTDYSATGTLRTFWMYFGGGQGHKHYDRMNLGIDAYGYDFAPEFGYPDSVGVAAGSINTRWYRGTLSHNTVMVDEKNQDLVSRPSEADILHFDDSEEIQLMDVDAPLTYKEITDIYRRTVISVDIDDEATYAIDFFRVKGGNQHLYSFHSQSEKITFGPELSFVEQPFGTYAGADIAYGDNDKYTRTSGYNYLERVRRATDPGTGSFTADFKVKYLRPGQKSPDDLGLKFTMLNQFDVTEVASAFGYPPQYGGNPLQFEYLLVKREGKDLDTLFASVIEPYKGESKIESLENIGVARVDGKPITEDSPCQAIKATLKSGRVDYVVYAADKTKEYIISDNGEEVFRFKGFVGVYTLRENGETARIYLHDGTILDDGSENAIREVGQITGKVSDFTKYNSIENFVDISTDADVNPEALVGKIINIQTDKTQNGAYRICGAEKTSDGYRISTGDVTFIRSLYDAVDLSRGYVYNINDGAKVEIPLTTYTMVAPKPEEPKVSVSGGSVTASPGQTVSIPVTISGNTGIGGLELKCEYAEGLVLTGVERGNALSSLAFTPPGKFSNNPVRFIWDGMDEDTSDGELVILTFKVPEGAQSGDYGIELEVELACDQDLNDVPVRTVAGTISVEAPTHVPGDADGNGEVNSRDIIYIRRYIAGGYGVTINERAADVDANGEVNSRDIIYIRRYIAGGYGIELK